MAKKRKELTGWEALGLVLGLLLLSSAGIYGYIRWMEYKTNFAMYSAFGIPMPLDYTIHGIDVSHHQDVINWNSVEAMQVENVKLGFAFIKATEGLGNVDDQFDRNWQKARDAGMIRGAYHFFLATKSGKVQANNFISTVELQKGDLPPVLDIEQTYGVRPSDLRRRIKEWLCCIEDHYKIKPIIYTNVDFYDHYLGIEFDEYPLWVAHYLQPHKPRIERSWIFWQHNETGKVSGIGNHVDFDVFNGDSTAFRDLLVP
ncbi:MAG: glycoside hydrolase [Bacteroidetes bacterium]|nr:MAG: glycoside hydrolase [Bacteroidota bacterium]